MLTVSQPKAMGSMAEILRFTDAGKILWEFEASGKVTEGSAIRFVQDGSREADERVRRDSSFDVLNLGRPCFGPRR